MPGTEGRVTTGQIQARADVDALKFTTAQKIRELLDVARDVAEKADRDADEFEVEILELVTEEG